jgi:hypothetical protein
MDWLCYTCSVRVSELRREAKRNRMIRPTMKLTSISSEHSVISKIDDKHHIISPSSGNTNIRLTTQETPRTSLSKVSNPTKTPKSVRFVTLGHDEHFYECAVTSETADHDNMSSSFNRLKDGVSRRWKRVGRCLRCMGRKVERPVISVLMRLGY